MAKILIATEKPFSESAVEKIKSVIKEANFEYIILERYKDINQLKEAVVGIDAMIVRSDLITSEVMDCAKNLKIIVRAGAGYDNVDCISAKERGICVMNTPGQNANAVAELALGMMVFMARGGFSPKTGKELKGKKIGIHAFGHVGSNVARIAQGFGMKVYSYDPFSKRSATDNPEVICCNSVEGMYSICDYVSLHIPAIPSTIKSINYELLKHLPQGATLVNTARKEVIDEMDMVKIMRERSDLSYISDIAPNNAADYAEFDGRYFFTPKKMGAQTEEANINAGIAAAVQIIDYINTGNNKYQVNK